MTRTISKFAAALVVVGCAACTISKSREEGTAASNQQRSDGSSPERAAAPSTTKLYLFEVPMNSEWCVYRSEMDWNRDKEARDADTVASIDYSGQKIAKVSVTQETYSGDWIVYDTYSFGPDNQPSELMRKINILPGDRTEELVIKISGSQSRQVSRQTYKLGTKDRPTGDVETWLPDVPIATSYRHFPFSSVVMPERLATLPNKLCSAVPKSD